MRKFQPTLYTIVQNWLTIRPPLTSLCPTLIQHALDTSFSTYIVRPQQTWHVDTMVVQCWATVCDAGSTLHHYWVNVSYVIFPCRDCRQKPVTRSEAQLFLSNPLPACSVSQLFPGRVSTSGWEGGMTSLISGKMPLFSDEIDQLSAAYRVIFR